MKPILDVTKEQTGEVTLPYVQYRRKSSESEPDLEDYGTLVVGHDDDGSIIGFELTSRYAENLERLTRFGQEHALSLRDLFSLAIYLRST